MSYDANAVSDATVGARDIWDAVGGETASPAALLREDAPHFKGRARSEAERLRAFLMARLAARGAAEATLPYALEDLKTGQTAHALAAAARVIRSTAQPPTEAKAVLSNALTRLRLHDRYVDLEVFPPRAGQGTSALAEVSAALEALPATPSCCGSQKSNDPVSLAKSLDTVARLEVQDQDGHVTTLGQLLAGRVCLLAFFYTRCTNPLKCSRTVSRLGEQDRLLRAQGVDGFRMIGISYEPEFDLPERLKTYGDNRSLEFSDTCMIVRLTGPIAPLVEGMTLNVGFGASTINAHRLEWLLADGFKVVSSGARDHWAPDAVADEIRRLKSNATKRVSA